MLLDAAALLVESSRENGRKRYEVSTNSSSTHECAYRLLLEIPFWRDNRLNMKRHPQAFFQPKLENWLNWRRADFGRP